MTTPKRLLKALDARDGHQCAWHPVGMCDPETLVPQHRAGRGAGGRPSLNRMSNLIWLCLLNGLIESDALLADLARDRGVKLRSHDEPSLMPIRHAVHGLVLLHDDDRPPTPISEDEAFLRNTLGRLYEEAS